MDHQAYSSASTQLPKAAAGERPLVGVRVLIVEDYPINVKMALRYMDQWGVETDVAENGQEAVDKALTQAYDLILMDLDMPVMDGYAATEVIRHRHPTLPILALTASAPFNNQDRAFAVGMTDYVVKPVKPNELFQKIARYASRQLIDRDRLAQLHDSPRMIVHAIEMFLDEVLPDFGPLGEAIQQEQWLQTASLAHKIVPWLGMAGLTGLEGELRKLETEARTEPNPVQLTDRWVRLNAGLSQAIPLLRRELDYLKRRAV